jgi:hypothetical protein
MDNVRSEDTLIFMALSPEVTNINTILDAVTQFAKDKQQKDSTDRFNLITFMENGPVYFEDFSYNYDYLISTMRQYIPKMAEQNVAGGVMVAITFIIDVFKLVGGKCFRLIILTDKNTPNCRNIEVVQDLINRVIEFPFFIDVVRIGTSDPREDLKYLKMARSTSGEVYYSKNEKETTKVLLELSRKKTVSKKGFGDGKEFYVEPENEPFFENLAEDVIPLMGSTNECQICREKGNVYKCNKCGAVSHRECLAQWAKYSNIGIPNLFRCQNCFNLLKLQKDFIEEIQGGKKKKKVESSIFDTDWLSDQDEKLRKKDKTSLKMVTGQNPLPQSQCDDSEEENRKVNSNEEVTILWCEKCGKMLTSEYKFCNMCGTKIKK